MKPLEVLKAYLGIFLGAFFASFLGCYAGAHIKSKLSTAQVAQVRSSHLMTVAKEKPWLETTKSKYNDTGFDFEPVSRFTRDPGSPGKPDQSAASETKTKRSAASEAKRTAAKEAKEKEMKEKLIRNISMTLLILYILASDD